MWLELTGKANYRSAGDLYLDGHHARRFTRESHNKKHTEFKHCRVSDSSLAPFLFSKLVITGEEALLLPALACLQLKRMRLDDDTYLDTSPSRAIGEIKLVISRAQKTKQHRPGHTTYLAPPHLEMVHERSKKAIAHRVGYVASFALYNT